MANFAVRFITALGDLTIFPIEALGSYARFAAEAVRRMAFPPLNPILLMKQMEFVGNQSFGVMVLAGSMLGGIFGLHLGDIFKTFGAESMMGAAAAFTLSQQMAPVTGSMLVTGRAGSAMAAEIAIMRVNEQIDAMTVMAVNPYSYLIAPRVLATVLMMPILTAIFILMGVFTSFFVGVSVYDVDVASFFERIKWVVEPRHVLEGLEKAAIFGFILASVGCYKGFFAGGGARGVGKATTSSVVVSFVLILITNFFISYIIFQMYE